MPATPVIRSVVLDATDPRGLAEFYRELLGYEYRPGDEPPGEGDDEPHWLVLLDPVGHWRLAFQRVAELPRATWPEPHIPQQLHLDLSVADVDDLEAQRRRAVALGAQQLFDRSADPDEPLYVFADPAGHPFCIFVA